MPIIILQSTTKEEKVTNFFKDLSKTLEKTSLKISSLSLDRRIIILLLSNAVASFFFTLRRVKNGYTDLHLFRISSPLVLMI